jgi:3-demethoxyubiquinol 3-hydroxylase
MITSRSYSNVPLKYIRRVSSSKWDYDVIISGGSIVGASLALDLLHATRGDLNICIIDQVTPPKLDDCLARKVPDIRTYALSPSSVNFLEKLGVWRDVQSRAQPYKSMQIWESRGRGLLRFHASEMNLAQLGHIVEDSTVLSAVYAALDSHEHSSSVRKLFGSSIRFINKSTGQSRNGVELTVSGSSNETLSAR